MNCATPTDFTFSFTGFARRGGDTDKHSDGWGLAFYEGRGIRAFHDRMPAASSPIAEFLSKFPIKTLNMMSHIRYATSGEVCLENVHPFKREMWGIHWYVTPFCSSNGLFESIKTSLHVTKATSNWYFSGIGALLIMETFPHSPKIGERNTTGLEMVKIRKEFTTLWATRIQNLSFVPF